MEPALPLKSVLLYVAVGALIFILVFLFLKRQITRFALKSSHSPHLPIAADAPKALRQEIERRLRRVGDIKYEPKLLHGAADDPPPMYFDGKVLHAYYRMKAVDSIKRLEAELQQYDPNTERRPGSCLRVFLLSQQSGALRGISKETIDRLCSMCDHARHETAEFREQQYEEFETLVNELLQHIRNKINKGENKKTFPFQVGDSVFYCSQTVDSTIDLKETSVRQRTKNSNTASFIKLKNRSSDSSQVSGVAVTLDGKEIEQAV